MNSVIKVADASAGPWHPRLYSYWSNAVIISDTRAVVFAGHMPSGQPHFFDVNMTTGEVTGLGHLSMPAGTTEGWSWDAEHCIYLLDGPRLRRVNPFSGYGQTIFDISDSHPGCDLWQPHAENGTHSATVRQVVNDGPYPRLGTVVYRDGAQRFFAAQGDLDESMISGDWLVIKEDDDNRIINLRTGEDRWWRDKEGALGHSDGEGGIIIGEDDQQGACVLWQDGSVVRPLFSTWGMGHISFRAGRCLLSDHEKIALVAIDGSGVTELHRHQSATPTGANLDPTGRAVCWIENGSIYLLEL